MKNKLKFGGLLALLGVLGLASSTASATPITFGFSTSDGSANITPCEGGDSACNILTTHGDLQIGGQTVGSFTATMTLLGVPITNLLDFSDDDISTVDGHSKWLFVDSTGANSLSGSLSGDLANIANFVGMGGLKYTIEKGTGLFANAFGAGVSAFSFLGGTYNEEGVMWVDTHPVPEPGVTVLLLAGLGMAGYMAWQRRRTAMTQI
jgi:hypothetical protein